MNPQTVGPTSDKQNITISRVGSFRENLFTGDLLETASQLISSMRQPGSIVNYDCPGHIMSAYHEYNDEKHVGQDPKVYAFLKIKRRV